MEALRRILEGTHHQWHVFNKLLDSILTATECRHGYIGEVTTRDGKEFVHTIALTNVSWSPETNALLVPKDLLFEVRRGKPGLIGFPIWTGKPFICADIGKHPMRGGQPPGHPPIKSLLSVPFHYGGKLVGVLSLGNRDAGFCNENIKQLQETLDFLGFIITLSKDLQLPEFIPPVSVKMDLTASMIDTISFGFIIFGPDMKVESINRTGLEMLGLRESDVGGPLCSKLFDVFPNLSFEIPWDEIAAQKDKRMLCQSVETIANTFANPSQEPKRSAPPMFGHASSFSSSRHSSPSLTRFGKARISVEDKEKKDDDAVSTPHSEKRALLHTFDAEVSISSVLYDKFLYFALIFSDVTERNTMIQELKITQCHLEKVNDEMEQRVRDRTKELEKLNETLLLEIEERKRADAKAQEAAESRSLFLSTVNHEIRTPANGILATAELLEEICSTDEQRQLLDILRISAVNLTSMVNRIVEFSRLHEGEFELQCESFALGRVIEDVSIFVGTSAPARRKSAISTPRRMKELATSRVPLYLVVHENVRELEVLGDPSAVRHVLHHIVTNARKFTDSGYILVRVRRCEPPMPLNEEEKEQLSSFLPREGTTWIEFEVEDTGIGISKKKMENLYVPFGQDGWQISRKYQGIGIGLSSVRQLLMLMKGLIRIESKEDVGTRVSVLIPFVVEAPELQTQQIHPVVAHLVDSSDTSTKPIPIGSKESPRRHSPTINILSRGSSFTQGSLSAIVTPHSIEKMLPAPFFLTVFCAGKHRVMQEMVECSLRPFVEELKIRWFDSLDVATMHIIHHSQQHQQHHSFFGTSVHVLIVDTLSLGLNREELEAYQQEWKSHAIPRVVLIPFEEMMKCKANGLEILMETDGLFSRRLALPCTSDMFRRSVVEAVASTFPDGGPLSKGSRQHTLFGGPRSAGSTLSGGEGTPSPPEQDLKPLAVSSRRGKQRASGSGTRRETRTNTYPQGSGSESLLDDIFPIEEEAKHAQASTGDNDDDDDDDVGDVGDESDTSSKDEGMPSSQFVGKSRRRKPLSGDGAERARKMKGKTPRGCALVVEDELINRKVMERVLKRLRWECDMAEDGLIALDKVKEDHDRYDIIFMDCRMDVMDGWESTREIRKLEASMSYDRIPIVAITAETHSETRDKCIESGMNDVLFKPVQLGMVRDSLRKHSK
eukprot:TRINITY_DN3018_c0_g1_i1.p1 TRINITY_DN3018_c0_g1~~TRINITY_DN3018_c0_g1_i1.p1  ORF type:complete len:1281 (-),score=341.44 TRINITY_DN3018_c0_g1_i1:48-3575(-)